MCVRKGGGRKGRRGGEGRERERELLRFVGAGNRFSLWLTSITSTAEQSGGCPRISEPIC